MLLLIYKLDLHYSHKDPAFLAHLEANHIVPFYVAAACTDVRQECDTVLNKTYKCGLKAAFRDYLYRKFNAHLAANNNDASTFHPKLTMGELKPHIREFVSTGIAACSTPAFKLTIMKAFEEDGCFKEMRGEARQTAALAELAQEDAEHDDMMGAIRMFDIPDEVEVENDEDGFMLDGLAQEIQGLLSDDDSDYGGSDDDGGFNEDGYGLDEDEFV